MTDEQASGGQAPSGAYRTPHDPGCECIDMRDECAGPPGNPYPNAVPVCDPDCTAPGHGWPPARTDYSTEGR